VTATKNIFISPKSTDRFSVHQAPYSMIKGKYFLEGKVAEA